jgi:N-methylhydantoinase B/oxoprolinase/acetone carboxylase alpha subunit
VAAQALVGGEEGLRIMRRGKIVPEVLATFQANTYQKGALTGDLMAQLAACVLGSRRWQERITTRWNAKELAALTQAQFEASARFAPDESPATNRGAERRNASFWVLSQRHAQVQSFKPAGNGASGARP